MSSLAYPDGLRRIRPAHVIFTREQRPTIPVPYTPMAVEIDAGRSRQ